MSKAKNKKTKNAQILAQTKFTLSKKQKQWAWFFALWLGGFFSVYLLAYVVKLLMGVH